MKRRTYGMVAGMIGSALGFWLWKRQRSAAARPGARARGTVIFDNTPTAPPEGL